MNRLKSIFISSANVIWAYFSYVSIEEISRNSSIYVGVGLILISVLPLGFFVALLSLKLVARTTKQLVVFTFLISVGVIITLFGIYQHLLLPHFAYIAISSIVLWLLYVYWYSTLPVPKTELKIGAKMPELTFLNEDNNEVSTSIFKNKKILYMFYRGNWCPLCMAQIKEISAQYNELEKRGVEVLLISPQPVSHSANLAKKMKVKFNFLTDVNNEMARKLKIDLAYGLPLGMEVLGYKSETVLPTVVITDEKGKIIYLNQTDNYRARPEPATFLNALDQLEA